MSFSRVHVHPIHYEIVANTFESSTLWSNITITVFIALSGKIVLECTCSMYMYVVYMHTMLIHVYTCMYMYMQVLTLPADFLTSLKQDEDLQKSVTTVSQ